MGTGNRADHLSTLTCLCISLLILGTTHERANAAQVTDQQGSIDIKMDTALQTQGLLVMLDNMDVTALTRVSGQRLLITPMYPLSAGEHRLRIHFVTAEGYNMQQTLVIDAVQQRVDYQGASVLEVTLRGLAYDKNDVTTQSHELDGHLSHQGDWQAGSWQGETRADVWWFDRSEPVAPLDENNPEVIDYYASAVQQDDDKRFLAEAGYLQLHQSKNTINRLARRGARASYQRDQLELDVFSVDSRQQISADGGLGVGSGGDQSIVGLAAAWRIERSSASEHTLRTLYSKGAESGDSFGSLSGGAETEGDVLGILMQSEFRKQGLSLELEFDRSSYDNDTSDALDEQSDNAYAIRSRYRDGSATYRAALESIGTRYAVVANPLLQNDRRFLTLSANYDFGEHNVTFSGQTEYDNLDQETTRARLSKTFITTDYRYRKGRDFSTLLSLQNSRLSSEDEPTAADVRKADTNSLLGKLNLVSGQWNTGFSVLVSNLDDQTSADEDNDILSYSVSPALLRGDLYFTPSYTYTETDFSNSNITNEQQIFNLHLQGQAYDRRLSYQLSGSLSRFSDNAGSEIDSTLLDAQLDWSLGYLNLFAVRSRHAVGMELRYLDSEDAGATLQDDAVIWITYKIEAVLNH